jgi:carboxyl-terminal processing protease
MNNKKSFNKDLPLFYALVLIAGILIGVLLASSGIHQKSLFSSNKDKLKTILQLIEGEYVDSISYDELVERAITSLLFELDPHSSYISVEDFANVNDELQGKFDGVGVQFRIEKDTILVVNTVSGGPSEREGVKAGDRIIQVDGENVAGVGVTNEDVMRILKGPKGSKVEVEVKRRGLKHTIPFTITRDEIPTYSVDAYYMYNREIGYVKLSKFSVTTAEEFRHALMELKTKGMTKLILDLRGNGGGYLDAAVDICDEFLKEKQLIVYTEGANQQRNDIYATKKGSFEDQDVVVLIDDWSASASEIVAGAIQDNDRGTIIGRRSFGKGLVQKQILLEDGSALRLTISRYHTPTGRCIQKSYAKGSDAYYVDIFERYLGGEMENKDSVVFADSLKYTTPKGKIVYGGGGIMPDIYIPINTDSQRVFLHQIINMGLDYEFSFDYADKNRQSILKSYPTSTQFLLKYRLSKQAYASFLSLAKKRGIRESEEKIRFVEAEIKNRLKAYIARNIYNDKSFYQIINSIDDSFLKAVQVLEKGEENSK